MRFEKPQIPQEFLYPEYGLRFNPFTVEDETIENNSRQAAYCNHVYSREAKRVVAKVRDWVAEGETSKLWIVKDMSVDMSHHIYLSGGILRRLMAFESLRVFPTVALLSLIYKSFTNGAQKALLDRFTEEHYRRCLFSYAYDSLKELVQSGVAEEALPGVDVPAFLLEIEESDGELLYRILYGEKVEEEEEAAAGESSDDQQSGGVGGADMVVVSPNGSQGGETATGYEEVKESDETTAGSDELDKAGIPAAQESQESQESEESEEEDEETLRLRALSDAVFRAVAISLEGSTFGYLGREVVSRGLISLEDGLAFIKAGGHSTDALVDILKFLSSYYNAAFVFVDRIDAWEMLDDDERKRVYAEVGEWKWVIGDKGCLALAAGPRFADAVDKSFLADAIRVDLDFHDIECDGTEKGDVETASAVIADFLSAARAEGAEPSIHPFTNEAIAMMAESTEDVTAILETAGDLLERAAGRGLEAIGAEEIASLTS